MERAYRPGDFKILVRLLDDIRDPDQDVEWARQALAGRLPRGRSRGRAEVVAQGDQIASLGLYGNLNLVGKRFIIEDWLAIDRDLAIVRHEDLLAEVLEQPDRVAVLTTPANPRCDELVAEVNRLSDLVTDFRQAAVGNCHDYDPSIVTPGDVARIRLELDAAQQEIRRLREVAVVAPAIVGSALKIHDMPQGDELDWSFVHHIVGDMLDGEESKPVRILLPDGSTIRGARLERDPQGQWMIVAGGSL